jgi:hypothetical protein
MKKKLFSFATAVLISVISVFAQCKTDSIEIPTDYCCTFTVIPTCTLVANFVKKTDVTETTETSIIDFYPNPTMGELRINGSLGAVEVEIYDIRGKKLGSKFPANSLEG